MKNMNIVLFIIILEYLVILNVYFVCFIRSAYQREIIIKDAKELINWLFAIVLWPIVLIIAFIKERRERRGNN